jgi:radical SAM superfamily enzyme YgiQ (UPF0313 family)
MKLKLINGYRKNAKTVDCLGIAVLTSYLKNNKLSVSQTDISLNIVNPYKQKGWDFSVLDNYKLVIDNLQVIDHKELIQKIDMIINKLNIKNHEILGFSIHTVNSLVPNLIIMKRIKELFPGIIIIIGGTAIGKHKKYLLKEFLFIDFLIFGQGEEVLKTILSCDSINRLKVRNCVNLLYRKGLKVCTTKSSRIPISQQSMPYFDNLFKNIPKKDINIPYFLSSGCIGKCNFCINNLQRKEFKSLSKIISEIKELKEKYKSNLFYFLDSNLLNDKLFFESFINVLVGEDLDISWQGMLSIEKIDDKLLNKIKRSGCKLICIGLESGSSRELKMMNKSLNLRNIKNKLRAINNKGILIDLFIMVGYPYEKPNDILLTLKYIDEIKHFISSISITQFKLIMNSLLAKEPDKYGLRIFNRESFFNAFLEFDEVEGRDWHCKQQQISEQTHFLFKELRKRNINTSVMEFD